jgi:hypothetical protein
LAEPAGPDEDELDDEVLDDEVLDDEALDELEDDDAAETTFDDDDPAAMACGEAVLPPSDPPHPLMVTLRAIAARDRSRAGRYALFMCT